MAASTSSSVDEEESVQTAEEHESEVEAEVEEATAEEPLDEAPSISAQEKRDLGRQAQSRLYDCVIDALIEEDIRTTHRRKEDNEQLVKRMLTRHQLRM